MTALRRSVLDFMQDVLKDSRKPQPPGAPELEDLHNNIGVFLDTIAPYRDSMSVELPSIDDKIGTELANALVALTRQGNKPLQGDPATILEDARRGFYLSTIEDMSPMFEPFEKYRPDVTLLALTLVASSYISHRIATTNNADPAIVAASVAEGLSQVPYDYVLENPGTIVSAIITNLSTVVS